MEAGLAVVLETPEAGWAEVEEGHTRKGRP